MASVGHRETERRGMGSGVQVQRGLEEASGGGTHIEDSRGCRRRLRRPLDSHRAARVPV